MIMNQQFARRRVRKFIYALIAAVVLGRSAFAIGSDLPPREESAAYQQYVKRPRTDLSKLIYLMDRFKGSDFKILFDSNEYQSSEALRYAKTYLAKNYKSNEKAESWLKTHSYRSPTMGKVIYFKFSDSQYQPLRDVLLEELRELEDIK